MVLNVLVNFVKDNFGQPPEAYLFLALVSILASMMYLLAQIFLVDRQKIKIYNERIKKWQEKRKKAMKTGSKRLMMEVQREMDTITKMQSEMAMEQFKPFFIFFIPFMLLFFIIQQAYGGTALVELPFWLPIVGSRLNAIWFYIFFNIIVSSILNTLLKIHDLRKEL